MASSSVPREGSLASHDEPAFFSFGGTLRRILEPFASLKLTVVLFAMAIFIVLAGTFAQALYGTWPVTREYFRAPFPWTGIDSFMVWVDFQIFAPPSFFPSRPEVPDWLGFWFPKGWLIGAAMMVNLLAAHLIRFKVQARGARLWSGLAVLAAGVVTTALVIQSGSDSDGVQDAALIDYAYLWRAMQVLVAGAWLGAVYGAVTVGAGRGLERGLLVATSVGLGVLVAWLFYRGDSARLDDSAMRILWQLVKASVASLVLLGACVLLFRKRAGVVLLHGGIALMMVSEVLVGTTAVEGQMAIYEGETGYYTEDVHAVELAVVDPSAAEHDREVVVPEGRLDEGAVIRDEQLPFDVEVVQYQVNSEWREAKPDDENPADTGTGRKWISERRAPVPGTETGNRRDLPSAYVRLLDKETGEPLGTYLVGLLSGMQDLGEKVTVGGTTWEVTLRNKREYKPYMVRLLDTRRENYPGTSIAKWYSSTIRLVDPEEGVNREEGTWMNNPLRFGGETFYQSGHDFGKKTVRDPETGEAVEYGPEYSVLSIVRNQGWMIPYVACMIVAWGMFAHFSIVLLRFLNRRATGEAAAAAAPAAMDSSAAGADWRKRLLIPGAVLLVFGTWVAYYARVPDPPASQFDYYAFGKLPVRHEGRIKPFDSLARSALSTISGRSEFVDASGRRQPAVRWLLDVISDPDAAEKHEVFRIENIGVQELFGLPRRSGYRYSVAELREKIDEVNPLIGEAQEVARRDKTALSTLQKKLLELDEKIGTYTLLRASFERLPRFPTRAEIEARPEPTIAVVQMILRNLHAIADLSQRHAPQAVPVESAKDWQPYSVVAAKHYLREVSPGELQLLAQFAEAPLQRFLGQALDGPAGPEPAFDALTAALVAYEEDSAGEFNRAVRQYSELLGEQSPAGLDDSPHRFEAFFNHFAPFYQASILYVLAFVLAAAAWLGWSGPLNRASLWLITFTFVLHTLALLGRMWISGRPPVTNLYSSAVFIGWGVVGLGILFELVYRLGIGNIVASVAGFATLLVAHFLSLSDDTFTVLVAVLDTQFWLATHVTCITFGYATTLAAGLLGALYIVLGVATPSLTPRVGRELTRMTYGTICFAIFFSFVGTVLGGLWADDSWGRFWGWDPKENGALIIVLWNALVLHARWGGMIKERGLAALAVFGNVVTAWSWFGTNQLGIGLHSYGFTDGALLALGLFDLSQLAIMAAALLPRETWWSVRRQREQGLSEAAA